MLFSLIIYIYLNNNVSANIVNRFVWASFVCLSCVKTQISGYALSLSWINCHSNTVTRSECDQEIIPQSFA